jgi:hypothetical protein
MTSHLQGPQKNQPEILQRSLKEDLEVVTWNICLLQRAELVVEGLQQQASPLILSPELSRYNHSLTKECVSIEKVLEWTQSPKKMSI